ncbi:NADH-quinone oxidoreductase subunit NuoK [Nonomuraea purpurea]
MHIVYPAVVSALLFSIGVYGVLARRNTILVLMSVELMLNAVNLNLVAFDVWLGDRLHSGQVLTLFVIVIAAAEVGLGLAIVLALYRNRSTVDIDHLRALAEPTDDSHSPRAFERSQPRIEIRTPDLEPTGAPKVGQTQADHHRDHEDGPTWTEQAAESRQSLAEQAGKAQQDQAEQPDTQERRPRRSEQPEDQGARPRGAEQTEDQGARRRGAEQPEDQAARRRGVKDRAGRSDRAEETEDREEPSEQTAAHDNGGREGEQPVKRGGTQ